LFQEQLVDQCDQGLKVALTLGRRVRCSQCCDVLRAFATQQLGQDGFTSKPAAKFHAQAKVRRCTCCSTVAVDERVDPVHSMEHERCQLNRLEAIPVPIRVVHEIVHQGLHAIVFRRDMLDLARAVRQCGADVDRARPILPCIHMQARNGVIVERLDQSRGNPRPVECNAGLDDGAQEVVLPRAVSYLEISVRLVVFSA